MQENRYDIKDLFAPAGIRPVTLMVILVVVFVQSYGQPAGQSNWQSLVQSTDIHLKSFIGSKDAALVNVVMQKAIEDADQSYSVGELTTIVNICSKYCNKSVEISLLLTNWLKEAHQIYTNKMPTEVNQFRGFLLAAMGKFPPNDELYNYIKAEFLFGAHPFNVAAAASAARSFTNKSNELVPLMEPFLSSSFRDQWVDITTPELNYPIASPTRVRYEIIQTLTAYGAPAFRWVKLLDQIAECNNCGAYGIDSALPAKAKNAAMYLRKVTPECCQKELAGIPTPRGIRLIGKQQRKIFSLGHLKLLDQEGNSLKFNNLVGKPFVLTFFYTQCANPLKCVSTVHRLGQLEAECKKNNVSGKMGIYGMTYDPEFDTPPILKKYGTMYGIEFNEHTKFLKTIDSSQRLFSDQLQLRVNYGAGSVNQHGIQLFIFDKKGRLAAVCDNDFWDVNDVYKILLELI